MTDRKSDIPPYRVGKLEFHCWSVDGGDRYQWATPGGRGLVGRNVGSGTCWARVDGVEIGSAFPSLRAAMLAIAMQQERRAAA